MELILRPTTTNSNTVEMELEESLGIELLIDCIKILLKVSMVQCLNKRADCN